MRSEDRKGKKEKRAADRDRPTGQGSSSAQHIGEREREDEDLWRWRLPFLSKWGAPLVRQFELVQWMACDSISASYVLQI